MKLFREHPSDLMITDLIMPDQEGVETITKLRREYPRLKIIAISGAFGGRYLRVAELLGADTVLQKPFTPQVLLDTVRKLLG
jgi:DNA-binding NarL/FixJ family response regulator